ncbi:MAG: DMT family transporter, partial [Pseudomonadota bacterium]
PFFARIPLGVLAVFAAWGAVIVYAASNPIVTQLVRIGEANLIDGTRNAITFTNLFVLASLISLVPLALLNKRDLTKENTKNLTRRQWIFLSVSALLSSALTPGLFFYALEHTTVTNMVLVGRIEPLVFILATWVFLRERLNIWAFIAGLVAMLGALVILGFGQEASITLGKGELATLGATLTYTASSLVARVGLKQIPFGLFIVFRTVIGTTLYFGFTAYMFGFDSYRDLFAPILLSWVWVYVGIVIILGQLLWGFALKHASAGDMSMATSFSPLIAIMIAMVLLGEDPGAGLIPGAAIMLFAIILGQCGPSLAARTRHTLGGSLSTIRTQALSACDMFDSKVLIQARLI